MPHILRSVRPFQRFVGRNNRRARGLPRSEGQGGSKRNPPPPPNLDRGDQSSMPTDSRAARRARKKIDRCEEKILERWDRLTSEQKRGPGAPKGNQNARKLGLYVSSFLTEDEAPLFDAILERLHADFVFNKSSDLMQAELVAVYFLRLARAQTVGDFDAAQKLDQMIRAHLRDLKTTKLAREGDQPKGPDTSPAEWATKLLEKAKRVRRSKSTTGGKRGRGAQAEEPEDPDEETGV